MQSKVKKINSSKLVDEMSDGEELQLIKFRNCQMFFRNTRINLILVLTIEMLISLY